MMQFRSFGDKNLKRSVHRKHEQQRGTQRTVPIKQKSPEEVYRIALSYERGDKYAKTFVSATGGTTASSTTGEAFQIKTEPVGINRGGYRNSRQRGRESIRGQVDLRGGHLRGATSAFNSNLLQNTYPGMRHITFVEKDNSL